ncbi:hypothetical protein ABZ630_31800, partial [Streptomyces albidoflavus]|uniref:hypothetical protein n=1 Tax=Streptomyces albidoflavus TaxID=1886 RepID=UPI0033F0EC51
MCVVTLLTALPRRTRPSAPSARRVNERPCRAARTGRAAAAVRRCCGGRIEERDISAEPFLKGKRNDSEVVKARAATDAAG